MSAPMMCGGSPSTPPATTEAQAITDKGKPQLEEKENKKYSTSKTVVFKSQLVTRTNYFIKVQVEDEDFIHIGVFESLPHENKPLALPSYQTNKTKHEELSYFYFWIFN